MASIFTQKPLDSPLPWIFSDAITTMSAAESVLQPVDHTIPLQTTAVPLYRCSDGLSSWTLSPSPIEKSSSPGRASKMTHRQNLQGHPIPRSAPAAKDFSFPTELRSILPEPFHNLIDSVANSGSEFAFYMQRYQHDEQTPYYTMSALLASFQILNYNTKSLQGGVSFLTADDRASIGDDSACLQSVSMSGGIRLGLVEEQTLIRTAELENINRAVQYIDFCVAPYRAAMADLEKAGFKGNPSKSPSRRRLCRSPPKVCSLTSDLQAKPKSRPCLKRNENKESIEADDGRIDTDRLRDGDRVDKTCKDILPLMIDYH